MEVLQEFKEEHTLYCLYNLSPPPALGFEREFWKWRRMTTKYIYGKKSSERKKKTRVFANQRQRQAWFREATKSHGPGRR